MLEARLDAVFYRNVYNVHEGLNEDKQVEMAPFDQVAVVVVRLAIADEEPKTFEHTRFLDCLLSVPV